MARHADAPCVVPRRGTRRMLVLGAAVLLAADDLTALDRPFPPPDGPRPLETL